MTVEDALETTKEMMNDINKIVNDMCPQRVGASQNHGEKAIAKATIFAKLLELNYTEEMVECKTLKTNEDDEI